MSETTANPASSTTAPAITPLAAALAVSSVPLIEYRGAQTPKQFSSTREELAALLTHAGIYDLGWKSFLRCAGRDRVRWLNGMVTNSVKDLGENAGCYAFVLNAQGRIQGDLDIYRRVGDPDALWLEIDRAQLDPLIGFVRRYIIMDQVTIDPEEQWTAVGIAGPTAKDKLAALGLSVAELPPGHLVETTWEGHAVTAVCAHGPLVPRYEIWIESNAVADLWNALGNASGNASGNALADKSAIPCGADAVEQLRILEGTPAYGIDIGDRDLPQETNQMRALNFNKGCYLGQEIVERIRSRGNVHRTLSGFTSTGNPSPKTSILVQEKSVGELTSVARIVLPKIGERVLALGHIRREALDSQEVLTADGNPVTPCTLPFDFARAAVQP